MPTPNDGSNGNKRPVDDTDPEIAVLHAFLENGFPTWVQRIPGDYLARRVAEISLRCQKQGKHIPTLTEGMATILNDAIPADRVLNLVVAWEDVSQHVYDPTLGSTLGQICPCGTDPKIQRCPIGGFAGYFFPSSGDPRSQSPDLQGVHSKGKSKSVPYKDRPITPEVIEEFLEELGVAEWMHELAGLIKRAVESDILDDPGVNVADLWRLLTTTHRAYSQKYGRYRNSPSKGSSKRSSGRSRRSSSKRGKSSRRRAWSGSSSSGSPSPSRDGSSSDSEFYWRGKYKFLQRDGIEYLVTVGGREFRTNRKPPGECDRRGGRHWEWLCKKSK